MKIKVTKNQWGDYINKEVNATVVGGRDGIFAIYVEKNTIYFVAGDDGSWWEIYSFNKHWLFEIIKNLIFVLVDINKEDE
jgi:hypothetical protein